MSLRTKLMMLLVGLSIFALGAFLVVVVKLFRQDKLAYVFDSCTSNARSLAAQARTEIQAQQNLIDGLLRNQNSKSSGIFDLDPKLEKIVIYKFKGQGESVPTAQWARPGFDESQDGVAPAVLTKIISEVRANGVFFQELPSDLGLVLMGQILRQKSSDGSTQIAVFITRDNSLLQLLNQSQLFTNFIVSDSGAVLLSSNRFLTDISKWSFLENLKQANVREGTSETTFVNGDPVLASFSQIGVGHLYAVSVVQKKASLQAIRILLSKAALFFVLLISTTMLISLIVSRRLTAPLRELTRAAGKVGRGHFDVVVTPKSNDEIGLLAKSFGTMTGEVSRLMTENIEKARMTKELETAKAIQETLFPVNDFKSGSLEISGYYEPASECGGDWWHYFESAGKIYVLIGDATGHGVPAALITSAIRAATSLVETEPNMPPERMMEKLNWAVCACAKNQIQMTLFLGVFDCEKKSLTYVSASHEPGLLARENKAGGKLQFENLFGNKNPRLGEAPDTTYVATTVPFNPGDHLFLYTDGLRDILNPEKRPWGDRGMYGALERSLNSGGAAKASLGTLVGEAMAYRNQYPLKDDVTFVICKFQ